MSKVKNQIQDTKSLQPQYESLLATKDDLKERIEKINSMFRTSSKEYLELLKFQSKFYKYSARNTKLIYSQNPKVAFVGSFKHWKDLGYSILKGQKGIKILAPVQIKYLDIDGEYIKYSQATKEQQDLSKAGKIKTVTKQSFKVGNVFDIMQTNCPKSDYPKFLIGYPSIEHEKLYQAVKHYTEEKLHCPVNETNFNSLFYRGNYNIGQHVIKHNTVLESTQKLSTTIHEMSHFMLHNDINILKEKTTPQIELEADSLSLMFHEQLGISATSAMQAHLIDQYESLKAMGAENKIIESLDTVTNKYHEMANDFAESINQYLSEGMAAQQEIINTAAQSETISYELDNEVMEMSM